MLRPVLTIIIGSCITTVFGTPVSRAFGFAFGGVEAAIALHRRLLGHVLGKDMAFFDVTPSGRIVNRFSRDAFSVDDPLPFHLNVLLAQVGVEGTAFACG